MSASLMPVPMAQYFDTNGVPLAGGQIFTYAAGTSTPLATYTDATGTTAAANPVVLDSGGRASIWLGAANYKIVAQNSLGVTQWTVDNVSSVGFSQLQAANTFSGLTVNGNALVTGNETVNGALTAASETITGTLNVQGAATLASATVTGNESVGGTFAVTGQSSLGSTDISSLTIAGTPLSTFVNNLLPSMTALSGSLVVSNVTTSGSWVIFTLGTTTGTRTRIAFGAANGAANGSTIPVPSGFSTGNMVAIATLDTLSTSTNNNLDTITVHVSAGVITATSSDYSGHSFTTTASWMACAWQTGF